MKEYRKAKGVKEQYNSLEALRAAWGLRPIKKRTSNEKKLEEQRNAFRERHKCSSCGAAMEYVGAGAMACCNPSCKGIKIERTGKDGLTITTYEVSYDLLDARGTTIAENLFD